MLSDNGLAAALQNPQSHRNTLMLRDGDSRDLTPTCSPAFFQLRDGSFGAVSGLVVSS